MRDWISELSEIDADCVYTYEMFLGRELNNYDEYIKLDSLTKECPMEYDTAEEFFNAYPELRKYYALTDI